MKGYLNIDIVLPSYHPSLGWEDIVIHRFLALQLKCIHQKIGLIIVHDGGDSNLFLDGIFKIKQHIENARFVLIEKNKGKGFALREGIKISTAEVVLYTDIDWPYTDDSNWRILETVLNESCDIAAGSRDDNYYLGYTQDRKLVSVGLRSLIKKLLKLKVSDTQCGLKAFNQRGKDIFLKTTINRFLFDLEFIFLASTTKNIQVLPVKVELRSGVKFSKLKWKILIEEGFNFIKIFIKFFIK